METVLDFGITQKEWDDIIGYKKDLYFVDLDEETAIRDIALLFNLRKDKLMFESYLHRLPQQSQYDLLQLISHRPIGL